MLRNFFLLCAGFCTLVVPVYLQSQKAEETLSGPDSHETGQGPHGHLFGDWGGERTRLEQQGAHFDFQYVSDSLANVEGEKKARFASWNRFRWTLDIDFGALVEEPGLYFHATA
jgi:carbohydrate-selective porin OprB